MVFSGFLPGRDLSVSDHDGVVHGDADLLPQANDRSHPGLQGVRLPLEMGELIPDASRLQEGIAPQKGQRILVHRKPNPLRRQGFPGFLLQIRQILQDAGEEQLLFLQGPERFIQRPCPVALGGGRGIAGRLAGVGVPRCGGSPSHLPAEKARGRPGCSGA